jgi:hypothetical protein
MTLPLLSAPQVTGTWYLTEAHAIDDQGARLYEVYGDHPSGVIHYGADGRMMALIAHAGRPLLSGDRQAASADERAAAYKTSIGYAGRFEIDGDWVSHHVDVSTYPNWVGTTLRRQVRLDEGRLVLLTAPQMQDGVRTVIRLVWQRDPVGV